MREDRVMKTESIHKMSDERRHAEGKEIFLIIILCSST
jgi:hypothetical protein